MMKSLLIVAVLLVPAPALAEPKADEIVCKREAEIGSLVRKKKVCMTRAEWERVADGARDTAGRLAAEGRGGSHCVPSDKPGAQQC